MTTFYENTLAAVAAVLISGSLLFASFGLPATSMSMVIAA